MEVHPYAVTCGAYAGRRPFGRMTPWTSATRQGLQTCSGLGMLVQIALGFGIAAQLLVGVPH